MASNRDPRPSYRRRSRKKPTSSATRSKRVKASTAPKPTSSTQRRQQQGKGSNKVTSDKGRTKPVKTNPVSKTPRGAQGPKTPPVQGPRQKVTGIIGTRKGSTKPKNPPTPGSFVKTKSKPSTATNVRRPTTKPKTSSGRFIDKPQVKKNVQALRNSPLKYVRGVGKLGVGLTLAEAVKAGLTKTKTKASDNKKKKASESIGKYNTKDSDGTVRNRKKVGPKIVGPKKVGPKKVGTAAQSFDRAFKAARKSGKKEFTWRGKRYNTKLKK